MKNSAIEWTHHIDPNASGRQLGAYKSAAAKIGCTLGEWISSRIAGLKWCFACRRWIDHKQFVVDRSRAGGHASRCRPCASKAAFSSRYQISQVDLHAMEAAQGGRCGICARARELVLDHDHKTGESRGLLCNRCNVGLGQFVDDPELMLTAIAYLEHHNG